MLARMQIGTKIVAAFLGLVGLLMILLVVTVFALQRLSGISASMAQIRLPGLVAVDSVEQTLTDVSRAIHALSNARFDADYRATLREEASRSLAHLEDQGAAFEKLPRSAEVNAEWNATGPAHASKRVRAASDHRATARQRCPAPYPRRQERLCRRT